MDTSTSPMGSLIGFDAATLGTPGALNRGRRHTDRVDGSVFAEVYDLAAFASTGSRSAARVAEPAPLHHAAPLAGLSIASPAPTELAPADAIAAERLYLDLTTGGAPLRVVGDHENALVMRLMGDRGESVRELRLTSLSDHDQGPEVA